MDREDYDLVLFDGDCGLCHGAVRFIARRDPKGRFRFAPLESPLGERLLRPRGLDPTTLESLVLVEGPKSDDPRLSFRSEAVARIGRRLSGILGPLSGLLGILPRSLGDATYRIIARLRHRIFGQPDCLLPRGTDRARLLHDRLT